MELGDNLNKAASFTGKLFNNMANLILLIVVNLIPIVNFILVGYVAKIIRENPEEPPKLSDYGKLFVDGLLVIIAALIYALIPLLVIVVGAMMLIPAYGMPWEEMPFPMLIPPFLIFAPLIIVGLVLLFAFMVIGVMAIGNMVRTGDFSKVFAFRENWGLIQRIGLANYLIWLVVMFIVLLIIGAIGSVVPWVGAAIAGVFSYVFFGKSLALVLDELARAPAPPST